MVDADKGIKTEGARVDFGALIDAFMPIVAGYLERDGGFMPMAGYLDTQGQTCGLRVAPADPDGPTEMVSQDDAKQSVASLEDALREQCDAGVVKASVIITGVRFLEEHTTTGPAIWGRFEHSDGSAMDLFLPYDEKTRRLNYNDASASPRDHEGLAARCH